MNEDEMVIAIRAAVEAHKRNLSAVKAAKVGMGYEPVVVDAMRTTLRDELMKVFKQGYGEEVKKNG